MSEPTPKPSVVIWYERYCRAAMVLFILVSFVGIGLALSRETFAARYEIDPAVVLITGVLWALSYQFMALVHYAAWKTQPAPWAWKLHAVVLAVGLTTLVLWPVSFPLLWMWFKPETKRYFGADV